MIDWLRAYCLSQPHTTEHVLWGDHLVFKIGGKMYAAGALSPGGHRLSFKCTPEEFAELTERPGIVPAPYTARMHWVALENWDALSRTEIKRLVKQSYDLVFAKLPKRAQAELSPLSKPDAPRAKALRKARKTESRGPLPVRAATLRSGAARIKTMIAKVRKAVFPAAGLGTRFLPATKAQPKEMLSLVDKPLIQYGVEEAMHSGVQNIIIVTGRGKSAIEDHFDVSFELEHLLETRNKKDLLATVRAVSDMIDVSYVRQKEALGLGHAVLRARELVADEPFSVILSDDVIDSEVPCLRQLLDVYEFYGAPVVALMEVPRENISAYGVVDAEPVSHAGGQNRLFRIRNMVEKPKPADAPSNLAIIGRYVLTPEVFKSLDAVEPGSGGEIQLTDGLKHLLRSRPIYGYRFEGTRYDAGDKLGFLKATVEFALKRYDLGEEFRAYLNTLTL